jgi:hypothetical protein
MESALNSALTKGGRIVDLAYAAIVHQLGITQRFFPQACVLPLATRNAACCSSLHECCCGRRRCFKLARRC